MDNALYSGKGVVSDGGYFIVIQVILISLAPVSRKALNLLSGTMDNLLEKRLTSRTWLFGGLELLLNVGS